MSSDEKDHGAIWQGPPASIDTPHLEPVDEVDDDEQDDMEGLATKVPIFEQAKQLGQYTALILIPLLLGGLASLIIFPLISAGHASVPVDSLWLVTIIIVVVTIALGVAMYYAGANRGMQALTVVGGLFLFILIGTFVTAGPLICLLMVVLLLGFSIYLAQLYFHPVLEGFVDIVFAFGKYSRTLYPGFNVLLPWEKVVERLAVEEAQWLCPMQRVQLSRNEDVLLRATVSYQLLPEDAQLVITQVKDWEKTLQDYFIASVQTIATTFSPEDFIAWPDGLRTPPSVTENANSLARREHINDYLYQQLRDKVATWGVVIHWVRIRDVIIAPHGAEILDPDVLVAPIEEPKNIGNIPKTAPKAEPVEPPTQAAPTTPPPVINEEVYKKVYKEVQDGKVTDPESIRKIAAQFQALADNPQTGHIVTFDAARAALNLYEQAQKYEEQYATGSLYGSNTQRDWPAREPSDDNLMGGG